MPHALQRRAAPCTSDDARDEARATARARDVPTPRRENLLDLQRTVGNHTVANLIEQASVQRDPATDAKQAVTDVTGIEVEPGPLRADVLGMEIPIPARMQKKPGSGQGGLLTAPNFALRMDPHALVGGLLDTVTVGGFPLVNPTLVWDEQKDEIVAVGQVQIPSSYPQFKDPTTIDVTIRSSKLGKFSVQGEMGPFFADFTLDIGYDTAALKKALHDLRSGNVGAAVNDAAATGTEASFGVSGTTGVGGVPLNYTHAAGTAGAGGLSVHGGAAGLIGLPAGTFRPDIAVPAIGAAGGAANMKPGDGSEGVFAFGGVTSAPDLGKLSKGDVAGGVSPFAYAQISAMRKTASGHQFSITLSAQYQLGSAGAPTSGVDDFRKGFDARNQFERHGTTREQDTQKDIIDPSVLSNEADLGKGPGQGNGFNISVSGTFDLLGSK